MRAARQDGLTLVEVLTGLVTVVVIAAITLALVNTRQLRARRADAIQALLALQAAQDRHFGEHAAYIAGAGAHEPPPTGLAIPRLTKQGYFEIEVRPAADGLGYLAVARSVKTGETTADGRCMELHLDQHGRRSAFSAEGKDTSADCWAD
jgi:Tfp pilus assembly protein PilE